ncbi:MAG: hypothetical protein IJV41_04690 [Oscillospiraceae bacterium]|nr:hypothetical protein [Oscillospiraceae bacterium]
MKQVPVKLGPLALLLTVISICLTVLAILSFTTARADSRLAEKYAETVQTRYALEARGQEFLADLYESDPSLMDMEWDGQGVWWTTLELSGARLRIGVKASGGEYTVVAWRHDREWSQDELIGNLWLGD